MKYLKSLVFVPVFLFAIVFTPTLSYAATQSPSQAQYYSLLRQLLALLEQELAQYQSNTAQPAQTVQTTIAQTTTSPTQSVETVIINTVPAL